MSSVQMIKHIKCALSDCEVVFVPRRKNMRYCCLNCAKKHGNREKRKNYGKTKGTQNGYKARPKKEFVCQYKLCGKTFVSSFYNPKYCCRKCGDRSRHQTENPNRREYLGKLGTQKMEYINPKFSAEWLQDLWDERKRRENER